MLNILASWLIICIPIFLITGPFLPDLVVVIISLFVLYKFTEINLVFKNIKVVLNFHKLFFLLCLYFIFTSIISMNPLYSLESSLFFFRFGTYSLGIIYLIYKNPKIIDHLFLLLTLIIIILFLDSTYQYLFSQNIIGFKSVNNRISSFFNTELVLGSFSLRFILIFSILFFYKLRNEFNNKILIQYLLINILSFIIIIYSGQRTSFVEYLLFVFLSLIFLNIKIKIKSIFIMLFTLSILISLFILKNSYDRIVNLTINQVKVENSFTIPQKYKSLYLTSLNMIKDNYIFGVGPKNFRLLCNDIKYISHPYIKNDKDKLELVKRIEKDKLKKQRIDSKIGCSTNPHNKYLQIFSETGIIGFLSILIFFLILIYRMIVNSIFNYRDHNYNLIIISYISVIIIFFPIVSSGNFFNNWSNSIIFYILSLSLCMISKYEKFKK